MNTLRTFAVTSLLLAASVDVAFAATTPGQPTQKGTAGEFLVVGDSVVSSQQLFLGAENMVYVVDKVENNPAQINGHPAYASAFDLDSNTARPMDIITNAFCAGGNVMGDGTWLNVGGNQAVTYGGLQAESQNGGGPYDDPDGRNSLRTLKPCSDDKCDWEIVGDMTTQRWYPTVETLPDGTLIILGGCQNGGYVNDRYQDNPTYEFFPSKGAPVHSNILATTLPVNLYPLTWLLPSGKILVQSNYDTVLLDHETGDEKPLDKMPDAVRTYPASAGTIMLPLTPANNFTATVLFCGGTNLQSEQWVTSWPIVEYGASTSCQKISPDVSPSYTPDDPLPVARSMANFIFMPDGKIFCVNGAETGTAGYGNDTWAIGQSYADKPVLLPTIYDPEAAAGKRWSSAGLKASTIPRMYHSSATLLPDGSILVSGSNPNADYNVGEGIAYPTEYRTEKFFPSYYNERRPEPQGIPDSIAYGGDAFEITLDKEDLFGDVKKVESAKVVIIRTGFSTHSMNMGQRYVELESTYYGYQSNTTAVLHVNQLPPNPSVLAPGPALLFVIVNGVPSVGVQIMVGNGKVGEQETKEYASLPSSNIFGSSGSSGNSNNDSEDGNPDAAISLSHKLMATYILLLVSLVQFGL
ncbi:copper radical oxidase [Cylindrobasidium torrendii FP15055 ss-10]|uniref:Copper radical oxidase n=1 Tax=Cylindrobasidium torrendii FP15055 ss-10 TaxID=1314674 RepID=A0A0D7BA31_9AGAR|nr:copper radical oxidase [Cylindrobasidium torrendii FP15055 ss-10]